MDLPLRLDGLTGVFECELTQRREIWRDGQLQGWCSRDDLECDAVQEYYGGSVPKWGSFPPLPADVALQ